MGSCDSIKWGLFSQCIKVCLHCSEIESDIASRWVHGGSYLIFILNSDRDQRTKFAFAFGFSQCKWTLTGLASYPWEFWHESCISGCVKMTQLDIAMNGLRTHLFWPSQRNKIAVATLRLNEPLDQLKSVLSKWIVNQIDWRLTRWLTDWRDLGQIKGQWSVEELDWKWKSFMD